MSDLAPLLQGFFTDKLMLQRQASPNTVAAYRDTFTLLLGFVHTRTGRHPAQLSVADLDAPTIGEFLQHLETSRGNTASTRNARLAAIHSFFHYAVLRVPEHTALDALIAAPDKTTWTGRRDHALLLVAVHTGLRVSELVNLKLHDAQLGTGAHVRCHGKGRKDRCTPLTRPTVTVLRSWLRERGGHGSDPLFPTRRGTPMSRDAVARLVTKHAQVAAVACPSLTDKKVTPHTLRHSTAMALLHAGVDISVIALWLGHESTETTQIYLHADMTIKERALARTAPTASAPGRYTASDTLLAFLKTL
jgi:integrase/recombinase XerD